MSGFKGLKWVQPHCYEKKRRGNRQRVPTRI